MVKSYSNLIDGKLVNSSGKYLDVLNPATGETIFKVAASDKKDVDLAVSAARKAFDSGVWSGKPVKERSLILLKLADLIERELETLARIESINQGKTLKLAREDILFSIDNLRFFAGASRSIKDVDSQDYIKKGTSILRREPIGVVAGITPWNYPFMMAIWKVGPALAMGNTVVLKPASTTPLTSLELGMLALEAGLPKGVLNVITGSGETVGKSLAAHEDVDMISITGNVETGKEIQRLAATNLKKVHLELGGKAPFIVFDDANLEVAAKMAVDASIINSGQDCTAAARIYVQEKVHDSFVNKLKKYAAKIKLGDPLSEKTDIGPLNSKAHFDRVSRIVADAKKENSKIVFVGNKPAGKGFFFPLHIITNVSQDSKLCKNEIFGPIILVMKFKTEEEVIAKSNDVVYGLASSVWTKDIKKAFNVANNLRFGEVWINNHLPLVSEMPHGGRKQSGHSSDLSTYALEEYTELKHIFVDYN